MCLFIVRVQRSSPRQHASIHPGLVSFLFIPSLYTIPLLNRKIFHLLVVLSVCQFFYTCVKEEVFFCRCMRKEKQTGLQDYIYCCSHCLPLMIFHLQDPEKEQKSMKQQLRGGREHFTVIYFILVINVYALLMFYYVTNYLWSLCFCS